MQPIALARTRHLDLYLNVLRQTGAHVERELELCGLGFALEHGPDAAVPMIPGVRFLRRMEHKEGVGGLGCLAAAAFSCASLDPRMGAALSATPTLFSGLALLCRAVPFENTRLRMWMTPTDSGVHVHSEVLGCQNLVGLEYSEWLQNAAVIAIVRHFVGPRWCPASLGFHTRFELSEEAVAHFGHPHVLTGEETAWVDVPADLLVTRPWDRQAHEELTTISDWVEGSIANPEVDFPASLKLLMHACLGDRPLTIERTAELASLSVRTLQRRLNEAGLRFSQLLQDVRFEAAMDLLDDPGARVIDVAYAVGYEDPSHFTRAFRRIAGVSPREYIRRRSSITQSLERRSVPGPASQ